MAVMSIMDNCHDAYDAYGEMTRRNVQWAYIPRRQSDTIVLIQALRNSSCCIGVFGDRTVVRADLHNMHCLIWLMCRLV